MKIKMYGEEGKADFQLKLIKGSRCYRLVAINKKGEEFSIVQIEEDSKGSVSLCYDYLKSLL
jgi:hypothetical protein